MRTPLRYGENPHQTGSFIGDLSALFDQLHGKQLSYNNLVDVDAAVQLMREFADGPPTVAILKHTNACGVAQADDAARPPTLQRPGLATCIGLRRGYYREQGSGPGHGSGAEQAVF
ncbi:MAG: hypothetical protein WKG07_15465 [Hymenobacter sp.]